MQQVQIALLIVVCSNPIHTDEAFAANTLFKKPIVCHFLFQPYLFAFALKHLNIAFCNIRCTAFLLRPCLGEF